MTVEAGGLEVWDLLRRGELHAAVALRPENETEFVVHALPEIGFLAACAADSSFRLPRSVEVRDLAGVPLLLLRSGFGNRKVFDAACRLEGMTPQIFLESSACDTLLSLARAGYGVAVIPASAHIDREALRVAALAFRGSPLASEAAVVWHRERRLPRYAEAFSTTLATHARAVIPRLGRAK
jgi:DNA-binding transcriptional LysR family regulator